MRLLHVSKLTFTEFYPPNIPKYAIASHRWRAGSEAMLSDIRRRENFEDYGFQKVQGFATYVESHIPEVEWLWIDTCCINQESDRELSEAINSMFRWYREAEVCLAYLEDLHTSEDIDKLECSVWFTRGWTLQELLAPELVVFLSQDWQVIGHKGQTGSGRSGIRLVTGEDLHGRIADITNISDEILREYPKSSLLSIDEKLRWMEHRETTREEDLSYCLLGILGVSMNIRYGDGKDRTRERLLRKAHSQRSVAVQYNRNVTDVTTGPGPGAGESIFSKSEELEVEAVLDDVKRIGSPVQHMANSLHVQGRAESLAHLNATIATTSMQLSLLLQHHQRIQLENSPVSLGLYAASKSENEETESSESDVASTTMCRRSSSRKTNRSALARDPKKVRKQVWRLVVGCRMLSSCVYDLAITHASSGWDAQLRVYNQVGYDSEIFQCCLIGDLAQTQRLVAEGKASLLDRVGDQTLLRIAASQCDITMCRWLLDETTWPDQQDELESALADAAYYLSKNLYLKQDQTNKQLTESFYRLFIEEHGLDVDLDYGEPAKGILRSHFPHWWWTDCPAELRRDIIFPNMSLPWAARTVEERFMLVSALSQAPRTVDEFLQMTGIDLSDRRLHDLRGSLGISVLQYIIRTLNREENYGCGTAFSERARNWMRFGSKVLRTSPNPHHEINMDHMTPFLESIGNFLRDWQHNNTSSLKTLKIWALMVLDAGLDLKSFSENENTILRRRPFKKQWGTRCFELVRVDISKHPTWSDFKIRQTVQARVYQSSQLPGSFPTERHLPTTISWKPSQSERDEGHWVIIREYELSSSPINADAITMWHREPLVDLIEQSQDDAGVLILMIHRWFRERGKRSRSLSSPPSMRRREGLHLIGRQSRRHAWLPRYHLCPHEMDYQTSDPPQYSSWCKDDILPLEDVRECRSGTSGDDTVIHRSNRWARGSFLRELYACRTGTNSGIPWERVSLHSYDADCPQGCGKFQWDKLQVPARFLVGHPGMPSDVRCFCAEEESRLKCWRS